MKSVSEHIYQRGEQKMLYVRRRIPNFLRLAYPHKKTHISLSLGTSDLREGKMLARAQLQRIDAEFAAKRLQLDLTRASQSRTLVATLSNEEVQKFGKYWIRGVLLNDEKRRQGGLDDADFDELSASLQAQRAELGRMLAQGRTKAILPAMQQYLSFCGIDYAPSEDEAQRAGYVFTRAIVEALDHQIQRQGGGVLNVDDVPPQTPHPLEVVQGVDLPQKSSKEANTPTWHEVFELWRNYVADRPKTTSIAAQTPWRDLQRFVKEKDVFGPSDVTPFHLTEFAQEMRERGLAVDTINERISKIKGIYKIAVGRHKLEVNPAADTLGFKKSSVEKRVKKRKVFSESDLAVIFNSPVFTEHKRSSGQSGEASYWIPVLMYYTGARPEELAGLALHDIKLAEGLGWYIDIMYSPADDESDDLGVPRIPDSHKRTLKNPPSIRRVPLSPKLTDLGFLNYVEWMRNSGSVMLFPTLRKDSHDKLSGSFSKFFGRYLRHLGITDPKKVLYSLRHNMKDFLELSEFPKNYKLRFVGHTSGDGPISDGYGSDVPLDIMFKHCRRLKFPPIGAKPWQPGQGPTRF